jgi:hypothetical protein
VASPAPITSATLVSVMRFSRHSGGYHKPMPLRRKVAAI